MTRRILICATVLLMGLLTSLHGQGQLISNKLDSVIPPAYKFFEKAKQVSYPVKMPASVFQPSNNNRLHAGLPSFPVDQCRTYTFRLLLGLANYDLRINDIYTERDGVTYMAGSTTLNGQQDVLLQKTDLSGQVTWTKTLGIATRNESVHRVLQMSDGNLVMIGTTQQPDGSGQQPLIVAADIDGNVLWTRTIQTPTSFRGKGIVVLPDNFIGWLAEDDVSLLYGRMDLNGNSAWMRQVQVLATSSAIDIEHYFSHWVIGYTGMEGGRRAAGTVTVDFNNGSVLHARQLGGATHNMDVIFHHMTIHNLRSRLTGILTNNGTYQLFRATFNAGGNLESTELFNTPGITFDITASSADTRWAEVIAFNNSASSPDLYLVKSSEGQTRPEKIHWKKKFTGLGNYNFSVIERSFDGGSIVALNRPTGVGANQNALLLKTDSAGLSPGCEGVDYNITKTPYHVPPSHSVSLTAQVVNFTISNGPPALQTVPTDTTYTCRQLNCPPAPLEDTCMNTFYRAFRSSHFCDLARDLSINNNDEVIVTGGMRENPYEPESERAFIASFNASGKLATRKLGYYGKTSFVWKHVRTADDGLLVLGGGEQGGNYYYTITRYDAALNFLWNRSVLPASTSSQVYNLMEASDGSIYLFYKMVTIWQTFDHQVHLAKLDAGGNLIWNREYRTGAGFITYLNGGLCEDEQHIYAVTDAANNPVGTILMKIDKNDGNLVWSKNYRFGTFTHGQSTKISRLGNNLILFGSLSDNVGGKTNIFSLDTDGNPLQSKSFSHNGSYLYGGFMVTANREIVMTGYVYDAGVAPYAGFNVFIRLDSNMNIINCKRIFSDYTAFAANIVESKDGGIYETGYTFENNPYNSEFFLRKYAYDGSTGNCMSDTALLTVESFSPTATNLSMTNTARSLALVSLPYQEDNYSVQQNKLMCSSPITCTQPDLTGTDRMCDANQEYEFRLQRNAGCSAPVSWTVDPQLVEIISKTDTLLKLRVKATGIFKLKAKLFSGCRWYADSIEVATLLLRASIDLGPDSSICPNNSLLLNARAGFETYIWQDGSTDSTITAGAPGEYYVTATDACGNIVTDTILISAAPPIPFDIGGPLTKCNGDSLTITAPAGFLNYSWGPDYNTDGLTGRSVIIFPATDTIYYVAAEKTAGCFAYDTISITVNHSQAIHLGNDTSFCAGDSITLSANPGFDQYQWSNGATGAQITVKAAGNYRVLATDANGCHSADTLRVINIYSLPVVNLTDDPILCIGETRILNAGSGYNTYLWQNGATTETISTDATGTYWVRVTDGNNCIGSDTTRITQLAPVPAGFLPSDTAICKYGSLKLVPVGNYENYNWSNGATVSSITISQPGTYSLNVRDRKGCEGTDVIIIGLKDCLQGFYAPNAFTPGSTKGKNDVFRPLLFGHVLKYELTIYNRWGQRIFHTTNDLAGWDGTFAGKPQDSNTYVWTCTYQLEGEPVKFEKGIVNLIR